MNRRAPHTGVRGQWSSALLETVMTHAASAVILVVADDDGLRQRITESLQGNQYWVLDAQNGEEAWDLVREHWPIMSLLLTEVVLPGRTDLRWPLVPAT